MKSPARLGESAPSTSTPSTGVEIRSAGDSGAVAVAGAGRGIDMTRLTLGAATDSGAGGGRPHGRAPLSGGFGRRRGVSDPTDPASADGDQRRPARPAARSGSGRSSGIDVLITGSWFIVALLISVGVRAAHRGRPTRSRASGSTSPASSFAVVLYLSVLLHEASHAVVAQRLGYGVNSITLHFLGGMTEIDGQSRRPRHEFWIAVVGPLTSIAVGVGRGGRGFVMSDGLAP